MRRRSHLIVAIVLLLAPAGCATNTEQGALFGGLFGAGTGAVAGHALGNTGAGAAVGAGVGALTGAAIGSDVDADQARKRALAAQNSQALKAATVQDVVSLTQSKVEEGLIVNYVRTHGLAAPLQAGDIIFMQQQGVSANVIAAMQAQPVAVYGAAGAVYEQDGGFYYDRPAYYEPRVGFGVSIRGR